ncbi:MAG: M3 family metallopeptidase [Bacteroidales bacterium]|nr:M3 family metallopeptidase [Bacteroidales bacterium]
MTKRILTISCIALMLGACGSKKDVMKDNPFLTEWNTPYGVPPFDQIKTEHYLPAFEEAMRQQKAEIDSIVNNTEVPTFENTIEALEYSGALLDKVSAVFFNLSECENNEAMEEIAEKISGPLSKHSDDINLNADLFARIKTVYEQKDSLGLNGEQMRLLEETYKGFVRGGANVPAEKQARFREINEQLSLLSLRFGNNVLGATNQYKLVVDDKTKLAGLTEDQLAAALEAGADDPATKGKYVFTLHNPSLLPFLSNCENRELRKEIWTAYANRCTSGAYDNTAIIDSIVNLRLERANILGFESHAAYTLDDCMAKTPQAVEELLMNVWRPAIAKAKKEAEEYKAMIKAEGSDFELEPCDWRYYSEKLRKEKYNLNDEEIRPYFSLAKVVDGVFDVSNKLYGLTFAENKEIPTYNKEAVVYEVSREGQVIAILYMDFHPRASKRSGAWMTEFRGQYETKDGQNVIPIISLVCNFTKPTADKPSLLTFDEAETLFHEFGHGLHGMLSKCHYKSLAGTSVSRDFVELPSQIMENWCRNSEVMKTYAKHYETNEVISDELIKKIENAGTYGQGFVNAELIAASLLDFQYHIITTPTKITLPEFEDKAMGGIGLIPEIISRYKSTYFQHIFSGGYSCGYYSYTWAAVLDNDAFEAFNQNGLFDQATADAFRTNVLERGNTEDPMVLYKRFRGQDPSITPLLRNRGLL